MKNHWTPERLAALLLVLTAFSGWRLWTGEAPGSVLLTALVVVLVFVVVPPLTDWWVGRMRALSSPGSSRPPNPPHGS